MAREKYFSAHSLARILCSVPPSVFKEAMVEKEKLCPAGPSGLGYYLEIILAIIDIIPLTVWGRWARIVELLVKAALSILVVLDILGFRTGSSKIVVSEKFLRTQPTLPGVEELLHSRRSSGL